jgi:hypothetical protein
MTENTPRDLARRGYSLALRRLAEKKATNVAKDMDVTDKVISTLKTEHLEACIQLLAFLDIKCVPAAFKCVDIANFNFLTNALKRVLDEKPGLLWDQEDAE